MTSKVVSLEEYRRKKVVITKVDPDQMPLHPFFATDEEVAHLRWMQSDPSLDQFIFNDLPITEDVFPPPRA